MKTYENGLDSNGGGPFGFEDMVTVQLWQRVPPDEEGDWKDTGVSFDGTIVNGPSVRGEHAANDYVYVMPLSPFAHDAEYGTIHPRQITQMPFAVEIGEGDNARVETLRFVVAAVRHNSQSR